MFNKKVLVTTVACALILGGASPALADEETGGYSSIPAVRVDSLPIPSVANISESSIAAVASAPTGLGLINAKPSEASFRWTAPASNGGEAITGYKFGAKLSTSSTWQYLNSLNGKSTYGALVGFTAGKTYDIIVMAVNASGQSSPSATFTFTAPLATDLPSAPPEIAAGTPTDTSFKVAWSIPQKTGSTISQYKISYSKDNVNWTTVNHTPTDSSAEVSTITGLTAGTNYNVKVAAVNSNGQGSWSSVAKIRTTGISNSVPDVPVNLTSTFANQYAVTLSWSAPLGQTVAPITDYVVQYKTSTSSTWNTWNDGVGTHRTTTITSLWGGTTWHFRVAAKNSLGQGGYSSVLVKGTTAKTAPNAPISPKLLDANKTGFTIRWKAPANHGGTAITDYVVQYRVSGAGTWTTLNDAVSNVTKATIPGTLGKTYQYRVAAKNAIGTSPYSSENFVVLSGPSVPTGLTSTGKTTNSITIAYANPANPNKAIVRDNIIQYRKQGTTQWVIFSDSKTPTTSTTITGLASNTTYEIKVLASSSVGWGGTTSTLTVRTL